MNILTLFTGTTLHHVYRQGNGNINDLVIQSRQWQPDHGNVTHSLMITKLTNMHEFGDGFS